MATTTSYSLEDTFPRHRFRHTSIGWQPAGSDLRPKALISNEYGSSLQDEELINLARATASLDHQLLAYVSLIYKEVLGGRFNAGDVASQVQARHDNDDIVTIELQFNQILHGQRSFSQRYLRDRHMLYYWQKSCSFMQQMLEAGKDDSAYMPTLDHMGRIFRQATAVETSLIDAGSRGLLSSEVLSVFGDRWQKLDQVYEVYNGHAQNPQRFANWRDLYHRIQETTRAATGVIPSAPKLGAVESQFWTNATLLWLTFTGTALCNVWTFALAYHYSTHKPGTILDADFWFLLQGSITQFFGLATSGIPLLQQPLVPKRSWVPPMILALLCTVLAPSLYMTFPTEWSSFLALIGSAVQAFIVLQLAIVRS